MNKERSANIVVLGCGHISRIVKMHYCFKNLSPLLPVIDQTNYVYSIDDQGRVYQNCKFHDPRGWGSDVRAWPYKSLKWICSIFYSINIQHIDCYCVKGLWCCFPLPSFIFIYFMMGLLIYKYEPLWQEVSVKSVILRWPLRPVGLLFINSLS